VRVNLVGVVEPTRQLIDDSAGVGFVADAGVVSLQRPCERLGHAFRLRAFDRGGAWHEADVAGEPAGVVGGVAAAVVGQPLDRLAERVHLAEPVFEAQHHKVSNMAALIPAVVAT
jgi:hypothetical protein